MTKSEARQLAAGYAWGVEDTILAELRELRRTAVPHGQLSGTGSFLFATAFADQQDKYNKGNAGMMPSVGHAYANWQRSGGQSLDYVPEPVTVLPRGSEEQGA